MSDVKFTEEESKLLIEEVAKFPLLFNPHLEIYKDSSRSRIFRDDIWKEIGVKLNRSDTDCRKRWKCLRDSFHRKKRNTKDGTKSNYKWDLYQKLQFLEPFMNTTSKTNPDSALATTLLCNEEESQSKLAFLLKKKKLTKRRRKNIQDDSLDNSRKEDENRKAENALNVEIDDDISSFGDHVKTVLKKLHAHIRIQAKNEIFNCLIKYELIQMELEEKILFRTNSNQAHQLQRPRIPHKRHPMPQSNS